MSKTAIAVTAVVAGGVGYWLGVTQPQEAEPPTPSNFNSGAVESAESLDAASQVYEHYIKIQQWGHHFDGKEDEDGNFHFYIITHRQDD